MSEDATMPTGDAALARLAIEEVCSGRRLEAVADFYATDFVDHVNGRTYHGTEGARQSIALYLTIFRNLRFVVNEQLTEGNRVASRWTLTGTHRGRHVRLTGIVISRVEQGRIVEDWAASDTIQLVRQLGVRRSLLLLVRHGALLRHAGRSS